MAETIISPGISSIENDQSFISQTPIVSGATIIGPTVIGRVGIPTICTTYTDYLSKFGDTFTSGSTSYSYFTSIAAFNYFNFPGSGGTSLLVTRVVSGSTTDWTPATSSFISASSHASGAPYNSNLFVLETLSQGIVMNSTGPAGNNNTLLSGSKYNLRWQIINPNINTGTFSLVIRQGNDSFTTPTILQSLGPLSLDPYSPNYIERVIGNQIEVVTQDAGEYYTQLSGSYPNQSIYVRVKAVNQTTPEYFTNLGIPKTQFTGSLPIASSGSFGNAKGDNLPTGINGNYYENITDTNIQGLIPNNYTESIKLLSNKEAYIYNLLVTPGLIADPISFPLSNAVVNNAINMIENRADSMMVIDIATYGETFTNVVNNASDKNTSYAAAYYPWLKTPNPSIPNQLPWVPSSTLIPRVYKQNDLISYPWFAPAGTSRGVIGVATQTEKILTLSNRNLLYQANINPIATFPSPSGIPAITVFGQKTLQKKASSLDRVNVRRLLITIKRYVNQIANSFVFEQNTPATRESFLSLVNPYLGLIQQQEGLSNFQVIMDDTNNPPLVVDNNQMVCQIYLQPTKTAEFIVLDFNILPVGATFS